MIQKSSLVKMIPLLAISWSWKFHVQSFVFVQRRPSTSLSCSSSLLGKFLVVRRSFESLRVASTDSSSSSSTLSEDDQRFLSQALDYARLGAGHTFPNPAVGCVLIHQATQQVLGAGFHPRAGYPHAEIFALLEAAGNVNSGVAEAKGVVGNKPSKIIQDLADQYTTETGPRDLFGDVFADTPVTAYVTLEPCCHYGKTPPCASSLVLAKVDRVVVGVRDPNPRVDGGGVQLLQDAGIAVDVVEETESIQKDCARLVEEFVKRIIPKDYDSETYSHVNGAMRRGLRSIAGRSKTDNSLVQVNWTGKVKVATEEEVDNLELPAEWMEQVDGQLWKKELINLRFNKAVNKKKLAKQLGERVAGALGAHVAQNLGHTVLLYRPGIPPVLDLEKLTEEDDENKS
jgi:diaminohydroxyphosphoribosylaminopyrimidine deaminase/5-amino-6-(5-phosphoribosylamino)uracil reductase